MMRCDYGAGTFHRLLVCCGIALASVALPANAADFPAPPPGLTAPTPLKQIPAFNLAGISSAAVRAEDVRGKVLIVRFWATW